VGTRAVVDGEASIPLSKTFPVGTTPLTAFFTGTGSFANESSPVTVKVFKALSTTSAATNVLRVEKGKAFAVTVRVKATGVTPTGVVKIFKGTRLLKQGTLNGGWVKIWVSTKNLAIGRHSLKAKYVGSPTVRHSYKYFAIRVVR
jgi:hypothetical protein